jgi:hypothetical protein
MLGALLFSVLVGFPFLWGVAWLLGRMGWIQGPPAPIEVWFDPLEDGEEIP